VRSLVLAAILTLLVAPFHTARGQSFVQTVKTGNVEMVELMLSSKTTNINERDEEGLTGLMVASVTGDSVMTELLLKAGADPNLAAKTGMTALHAAAFNTHEKLIPMLLSAGADPNVYDSAGRTDGGSLEGRHQSGDVSG
jgi:uncharacterized protein